MNQVARTRAEAERMITALAGHAEEANPGACAVDTARTRLVAALVELADEPGYADLHAEATVVLDQLSDMLEDNGVRLGW